MALFENFPYTDMHRLDLDWILKKVKDGTYTKEEMQSMIDQAIADMDLPDLPENVRLKTDPLSMDIDIESSYIYYHERSGAKNSSVQSIIYYNDEIWLIEHYRTAGDAKIVKINKNTGAVISDTDLINSYHGNSACTDGRYLYVAGGDTGGSPTSCYLSVYNIENFGLIKTIYTPEVLGHFLSNINYDENRDLFYLKYTNKLWQYSISVNSATNDISFELKATTEIDDFVYRNYQEDNFFQTGTHPSRQDTFIFKSGYIGQIYSYPAGMEIFNVDTGEMIMTYSFPTFNNIGMNISEIESFAWDPINQIFWGAAFATCADAAYNLNQIIKWDPFRNAPNWTNKFNRPLAGNVFYVDGNVSSGSLMYGTALRPFRFIEQALQASLVTAGECVIVPMGGSLGAARICGITNAVIDGRSEQPLAASSTIGEILLRNSRIYIGGSKITIDSAAGVIDGSYSGMITIDDNSSITLQSVNINSENTPRTYSIRAQRGGCGRIMSCNIIGAKTTSAQNGSTLTIV